MKKSFIVMFVVAMMATMISCSKDPVTNQEKEKDKEEEIVEEQPVVCSKITGDRLILQSRDKDLFRTLGFDLQELRLYYIENGTQKEIQFATSEVVDFEIPSTLIHWVADKSFFKDKEATLYIEINDKNTVNLTFKQEAYCRYSLWGFSDEIGSVNEGGDGIIRLGVGLNY